MNDLGFGLWMTAIGMGTAFSLLLVLMVLLRAMSWFDERSQRKVIGIAGEAPAVTLGGVAAPGLSAEDEAAIAVAVSIYAGGSPAEPEVARAPAGQADKPWVVITRGWQHDHYPRRR